MFKINVLPLRFIVVVCKTRWQASKTVIKYLDAFLFVISTGFSLFILSKKLFIAEPELPNTFPNLTTFIFFLLWNFLLKNSHIFSADLLV